MPSCRSRRSENFPVALRAARPRATRAPPDGDLRLRAARRPARRRGRRRPARAARRARGATSTASYDGEPEHPLLRRARADGARPAACRASRSHRLIEANRRDQTAAGYATYDDLLGYCDALGESGRRARAARLRRRDARAHRALGPRLHGAAARRALAGRRARTTRRGRVYLPAEDLERFGVARGPSSAHDAPTPRCGSCSRSRSRARAALLDEGAPLVGRLQRPRAPRGRRLRRRRPRGRSRRSLRAELRRARARRRRRARRARLRQTLVLRSGTAGDARAAPTTSCRRDRARVRLELLRAACGCCRAERRDALFALYALARRIDDIADGALPADEKLAALERDPRGAGRGCASADRRPCSSPSRDAARRLSDPARRVRRPRRRRRDGRARAPTTPRSPTSSSTAGASPARSAGSRSASSRLATATRAERARRRPRRRAPARRTSCATSARTSPVGRVYLPAEDLERFGCRVADGRLDGPVELLVAFEAERALGWLDRGLELVPLLDRRSAACVLAMAGAYRRLLERIAARAGARRCAARARRSAAGRRAGSLARSLARSARDDGARSRSSAAASRASPRRSTCADAGASVTLTRRRRGSAARRSRSSANGHWIDNGQHVALRCCTAYRALPRTARRRAPRSRSSRGCASPCCARASRRRSLSRARAARAAPPRPRTLLRYALLAQARAASARSRAPRAARLDPDDPTLDERTFGDWLREHGQSERAIDGCGT